MQGVAAKNDASYDLSRARASVTGQTTIAPVASRSASMCSGSLYARPASITNRRICMSTAIASSPTNNFKKLIVFGPTPWTACSFGGLSGRLVAVPLIRTVLDCLSDAEVGQLLNGTELSTARQTKDSWWPISSKDRLKTTCRGTSGLTRCRMQQGHRIPFSAACVS